MTNSGKQTENTEPDGALQITVPFTDSVMDDVLQPLDTWLDRQETLTMRNRMALQLILEELLANMVMHGQAQPNSEIGLKLAVLTDGIAISFRDSGAAFNPATDLPPDSRDDQLEDRPVGRLGWPLILHYCSITGYRRVDGENRLELKFRLDV